MGSGKEEEEVKTGTGLGTVWNQHTEGCGGRAACSDAMLESSSVTPVTWSSNEDPSVIKAGSGVEGSGQYPRVPWRNASGANASS